MNIEESETVSQKIPLLSLAIVTGVLLLIPFTAMLFTDEVNWNIADFIVMGFLLFGFGSIFLLVSRKTQGKNLIATGIALAIVLLFVWAELAVGVFFGLGS